MVSLLCSGRNTLDKNILHYPTLHLFYCNEASLNYFTISLNSIFCAVFSFVLVNRIIAHCLLTYLFNWELSKTLVTNNTVTRYNRNSPLFTTVWAPLCKSMERHPAGVAWCRGALSLHCMQVLEYNYFLKLHWSILHILLIFFMEDLKHFLCFISLLFLHIWWFIRVSKTLSKPWYIVWNDITRVEIPCLFLGI